MARRSDWSASGGGLSSRGPPPPSHYGGHPFESYAPPSHGRHPNESPYGAPPPSYGGPPPSYGGPPPSYAGRPPSYGHSSSSFQPPPHGSYESSYYDGPPPGPPPRSPGAPRSWGGPPPPSSASSYGPPPAYEGSPYSQGPPGSYPGGSPSAPRPTSYSHRGGRGGTPVRFFRSPNGAPASEDSKSVNSSTGRRLPIHRQRLKPTPSGPAPWQPPSSRKTERPESFEETDGEDPEKKDGDPLALLAKVSGDMEAKPGSKKGNAMEAPMSPATPKTNPSSMAPPTSPLARRHHAPEGNPDHRASPVITPNPSVHTQASWKRPRAADDYSASSSRRSLASGPKPITPMPPHYMASGAYDERGPPPPHHTPYGPPPTGYSYYTQGGPPPHHGGGYGPPPPGYEGGPPPGPPPYGHYAYPHVVERHSFDSQESGSLTSQESWRRGPYGPPPPHGPMEGWYPPPTTPYPGREGGPPGPPYVSPYSHIPQPAVEEKTVLRKKFSWKHYPELERFLISNRDAYLEHSSKNYTAEQKQYNNWLTERLLEVADQHSYVFDPEDFNFVAIRDRIRCYYKSYVQTARKRGLELPGNAHLKRSKMSHESEDEANQEAGAATEAKKEATTKPSLAEKEETREEETIKEMPETEVKVSA